jgi:hypothetical protein
VPIGSAGAAVSAGAVGSGDAGCAGMGAGAGGNSLDDTVLLLTCDRAASTTHQTVPRDALR